MGGTLGAGKHSLYHVSNWLHLPGKKPAALAVAAVRAELTLFLLLVTLAKANESEWGVAGRRAGSKDNYKENGKHTTLQTCCGIHINFSSKKSKTSYQLQMSSCPSCPLLAVLLLLLAVSYANVFLSHTLTQLLYSILQKLLPSTLYVNFDLHLHTYIHICTYICV